MGMMGDNHKSLYIAFYWFNLDRTMEVSLIKIEHNNTLIVYKETQRINQNILFSKRNKCTINIKTPINLVSKVAVISP